MNGAKSSQIFKRAQECIPGGVNSPVRAFRSVGMEPPFIERAKGSRIYDVDGNEYIDFVSSWGPMILGHAEDAVIEDIVEAAGKGTSYGAPTLKEVELAELICSAVPSLEMVRLVSSGTEAVMSALRLARAFTNKEMILKFDGCYHGHSDSMLVKAGSGALTNGIPDSSGVPECFAANTISVAYNDLEAVQEAFQNYKGRIAAIIVEPVAANMGVVPPKKGFLEGLREICNKDSALLIFDEVITGFRLAFGGAQEYFGVQADISVYGKIIGGGLPMGAYGGRKEIMRMVSPLGPVYQAGTLSGNPLATSAGFRTLSILREQPAIYEHVARQASMFEAMVKTAAADNKLALTMNRVGSILSVFFTDGKPVYDYSSALSSNLDVFRTYFRGMLQRGIYIAPSQFEALFFSKAHSDEDISVAGKALREVFATL